MNYFRTIQFIALALVLTTGLTACKRKQPPVTKLGDSGMAGGGRTRDIGAGTQFDTGGTVKTTEPGGGEQPNWNPDDFAQDRNALAAQAIYFDFDSASVRSSEQSKLEAVAGALRSDTSAKLLIEGNCDERGTEEYNRSLGERRALAAREGLVAMGIDSNRVASRSYGEDRPSMSGHDEAAWSKNRRAEFVLLHAK